MIEQNTLVAEPAQVIPADRKSFRNISPDHKRALGKAQEGLERPLADRDTRLAQANEQLRHEIQERRHAEELLLKEQRYFRCLLELQDRDRQVGSCEIHDGLVQQLAAVIIQLEVFSWLTGQSDNEVCKTFETGLQRLNECMREALWIIRLCPTPLVVGGIDPGLLQQIQDNFK